MNAADIDILSLDSLPMPRKREDKREIGFPRVPGIYFVMRGEDVVYIGESHNLFWRIVLHGQINLFREMQCDRVAWLEYCPNTYYSSRERRKLESEFIKLHRPALNKMCNPDVPRKRKPSLYGDMRNKKEPTP